MKKAQMKRWICAMTSLVLAVGLFVPCHAMTRPEFIPISGLTEFLAWYRAVGGECMVTGELVIGDDLVLDGSSFAGVNLLTAPIRVAEGGSLTIRNPKFCLAGPPNVICLIRVEPGGRLCLEAGGIYGRPGTDVVVVAPGGVVEQSAHFLLTGDLSNQNGETLPPSNDSPQPNPPTDAKPEPEPKPVPESPILSVTQWQRNTYRLALWFETEPCGLVEEEIESIEIYRSSDGTAWELRQRLTWDEKYDGLVPDEGNAHSSCWVLNGKVKLQYAQNGYDRPFYLRISIETNTGTLESQALFVRLPDEVITPPRPGSSVGSTEKDEDGSSGNRGGGQGSFDREGQKEVEGTPAPSHSVVETALPQAEYASQETPSEPATLYQSEVEEDQPEQEPSLRRNAVSGGWSGNDGALGVHTAQAVVQPIVHQELDAMEETLLQTPGPADVAPISQEAEKPQSSSEVQSLAAVSDQTAPTDDGDTIGLVAAATLATCLLSAAGLYILHKRSLKRKS